jgi:hypothetical protein
VDADGGRDRQMLGRVWLSDTLELGGEESLGGSINGRDVMVCVYETERFLVSQWHEMRRSCVGSSAWGSDRRDARLRYLSDERFLVRFVQCPWMSSALSCICNDGRRWQG